MERAIIISEELVILFIICIIFIILFIIKLCKKLIYSYSTRLAVYMPESYLLTNNILGEINQLHCHIANYTNHLVTIGNSVNSYLTSTVDKTYHRLVIAHFSVEILRCLLQFLATPEVP